MAFNMLAQAEAVDAQGYGAQERRLVEELRQLLDMPDLAVSVTFVQAPVFFGESLLVSLQGGVEADMPALSAAIRSEEHTSELQSLMRISYAVFCLNKKNHTKHTIIEK